MQNGRKKINRLHLAFAHHAFLQINATETFDFEIRKAVVGLNCILFILLYEELTHSDAAVI